MTHDELVERAGRWLRSSGFKTVVAERLMGGCEEPDAIGWKSNGFSRLVECKASRGDFLADAEKSFRIHPPLGMGNERIYFAPPGIIRKIDLPKGWGLAEALPNGRVSLIVWPEPVLAKNAHAELGWLIAYTRRREGVSKRMRKPATLTPFPASASPGA